MSENKATPLSDGHRQLLSQQLTAVAELHEAQAKLARTNLQLLQAGLAVRLSKHDMACW